MSKKLLAIIFSICLFPISGQALIPDKDTRISLITCYPGQDVYELYGHTAIRISDGYSDLVYNFGMFSFNRPNFIYRFVKGETDYMLGAYPFDYFLPEYAARNSKVVEQVLNLTPEQTATLSGRLKRLSQPDNREYRYNYVFNNCATRPRDLIEETVGGLSYPQPADTTLTFRGIMRSYSRNYPWYQFGIDLALGSGIDYRLDTRQQMFAPVYLMNAMSGALYKADGFDVPVVKETHVLFDGSESPVLPPTPWYLSPMFTALLLLTALSYLTFRDIRSGKISRWADTLWFTAAGFAGCLVFFLIFISEHEATAPNYLGFWLNPFCLFPAVAIWIKSCKKWLYSYHFINFALVLTLAAFWPALQQSANAAFWPLMLCSAVRSAANVIVYKKCEKRNK